MNDDELLLDGLIRALPGLSTAHAPGTDVYTFLELAARRCVQALFRGETPVARAFGPLGSLSFPYARMGAIDSLHLFGIDELILFSFYWSNRSRYRRALDLGANLGLHSIMLSRCGMSVRAYEPDPHHFALLRENLARNGCSAVEARNQAVSLERGTMEFVRVLGNTTGSHLAGSKPSAYGELERFPVQVEAFSSLLAETDLMKMDVEGHERLLLCSTSGADWSALDAVVEIGTAENAAAVFAHLRGIGVNMFAQQLGWRRVERMEDMPTSYRNGSLFVSRKPHMPWGPA